VSRRFRGIPARLLMLAVIVLSGCGLETAGTAASVAKLQAEQAKQGKESLDAVRANLDAAAQASQDKLKRAEEGERTP